MTDYDKPVEDPTYLKDIRYFFTDLDIDHMDQLGIDLATYDGVKENALAIYNQTLQPGGRMPPPPSEPWSAARSQTFRNWIQAEYPMGKPAIARMALMAAPPVGSRVRRNLAEMSEDEVALVVKAFEEIMAREPDHPQSYFQVAGLHWFPKPYYCVHHENRYNPWHRVYMERIEDALRSVEGCEDVTMPYWDILADDIPDVLFSEPLASYTLQADASKNFPKGYTTERNEKADILAQIASHDTKGYIAKALKTGDWSTFNDNIMIAHDGGHNSTGPTMANQAIAAFDPIFWFFHCNWDRLWWKWQVAADATTVKTFLSTVQGDTSWVTDAPFNEIAPFEQNVADTIPTGELHYIHPEGEDDIEFENLLMGNAMAAQSFRLGDAALASVRVKGIDRMRIPGTFAVHLRANDETIRKVAFFQPDDPNTCETCRKKSLVNFDFEVPLDQLTGKELSVTIEVSNPENRISRWFPLSIAGDPTVNVRTLLEGH